MADLDLRPLGASPLAVTPLSLGSWRTFERIGRERGLEVLRAARTNGINFLDDARYNDETGDAPIATGYSEVLFGELFRAAGFDRDSTVVSNKLWWEFWPRESAAAELDGSLKRMGFDHIDLIYANPPPDGLPVGEMVAAVGQLVASGKARAWGIVNWQAGPLLDAIAACESQGVPMPCAAQLPYSLAATEWVQSAEMTAALEASRAGLVASFVMAGGALTGKYDSGGSGRWTGASAGDARFATAREVGRLLSEFARERGLSPAALAIAFALAHPATASVLFGATSPAQLDENVGALAIGAATVRELTERVGARA